MGAGAIRIIGQGFTPEACTSSLQNPAPSNNTEAVEETSSGLPWPIGPPLCGFCLTPAKTCGTAPQVSPHTMQRKEIRQGPGIVGIWEDGARPLPEHSSGKGIR